MTTRARVLYSCASALAVVVSVANGWTWCAAFNVVVLGLQLACATVEQLRRAEDSE